MSLRRTLAIALVLGLAACGGAPVPSSTEPEDIPVERLASTLFTDVILSQRTYEAFATEGGGFGQAGHALKFVFDTRAPDVQSYFVNSRFRDGDSVPAYAVYHYEFTQHVLGVTDDPATFNARCYYTDDKDFIAGSVQTYTLAGRTAYAMQFFPDDVIHEEGLVQAARIFRERFRVPDARLLFVATGPHQTFARVEPQLRALGVEPMTIEQVLGDLNYMPLNYGEAWGVLRMFPQDQLDLRPIDIPVFDSLPLSLSVVAGTITRSFQDITSHVNLKAKERGTPNMVLRDAGPESPDLAPFVDQPVHLTVGKTGFSLEPTTLEIVEQKYRERMDRPWIPVPVASEPRLRDYDDFCPLLGPECVHDGGRFGGKANGLGLLPNRDVLGRLATPPSLSATMGYDLAPFGFAIPVIRYRDFLAQNPTIGAQLDALIAAEKSGGISGRERAARVESIQRAFYMGAVPAAQLAEVESAMAALRARFPYVSELKFRSSANAEDIPGFDGAGLYDSFSVKYAAEDRGDRTCQIERSDDGVETKLKVQPRTAQCAIKAVYASLWNPRAIEERSFARLDHASAAMGIAVVPAYDSEAPVSANGVAITRALGIDSSGYTLSLQRGNNTVTNPLPGTLAERTLVTFSANPSRPNRYTLIHGAVPTPGSSQLTESVLDFDTLERLTRVVLAVERGYCNADPRYAEVPVGSPRADSRCSSIELNKQKKVALDMEFKILQSGKIVLKQVREFSGR